MRARGLISGLGSLIRALGKVPVTLPILIIAGRIAIRGSMRASADTGAVTAMAVAGEEVYPRPCGALGNLLTSRFSNSWAELRSALATISSLGGNEWDLR